MARNKYIYHHFVNGEEVSKEEFIDKLNMVCTRCDTHYDNPLLNISYTDTDMVKRKYDYLKLRPRCTWYYVDYKLAFHITRELKNKEAN